jgi:hypothetical protein
MDNLEPLEMFNEEQGLTGGQPPTCDVTCIVGTACWDTL